MAEEERRRASDRQIERLSSEVDSLISSDRETKAQLIEVATTMRTLVGTVNTLVEDVKRDRQRDWVPIGMFCLGVLGVGGAIMQAWISPIEKAQAGLQQTV